MPDYIPTGDYAIRALPSEHLIGRNMAEDDSYGPKGIYSQPPGVPITLQTTFRIQQVSRDIYYIKLGFEMGRVVDVDGALGVAIFDFPMNERWSIRRQPQHGDDIYTIETEDGHWGWVMPEDEPFYTPVVIRPLVASQTAPPLFTPNSLWIIERVR